jgi:alanyl-tRNA synthetase
VGLGIEKDRLYATYFEGNAGEGLEPDEEAARLWKEVTDIDPSHILPGDKKDNFWEMGDTGPCGPCSEIHIDLTPDKSGAGLVNAGDARVIELWNLVFIQFNRAGGGKLTPLPAKHVDTGMGFERLCAVLQGMEQGRLGQVSNYDTDVFTPIFAAIQQRTGALDYQGTLPEPSRDREGADQDQVMLDVSYRVIADHLRCLTFALTDGAVPSNERRGYVLRRILRRAVRYGRQYMDMHEPFLCDLVQPLVDHMRDAFPGLRTAHNGDNVRHVSEVLRDEEESFLKTLDRGIALFNQAYRRAIGRVRMPRNVPYVSSSLNSEEELDRAIEAWEQGSLRSPVGSG